MRVFGMDKNRLMRERFCQALPYHWFLVWSLGEATGLRIGDLLQLRVEHLAIKGHISVIEQKTKNERSIRIPDALRRELRNYCRATGKKEWVFESSQRQGFPFTQRAALYAFKRAAMVTGVPINIGTHSMRKSYALQKMASGTPPEALQEDLGHKYISTTLLYLFRPRAKYGLLRGDKEKAL